VLAGLSPQRLGSVQVCPSPPQESASAEARRRKLTSDGCSEWLVIVCYGAFQRISGATSCRRPPRLADQTGQTPLFFTCFMSDTRGTIGRGIPPCSRRQTAARSGAVVSPIFTGGINEMPGNRFTIPFSVVRPFNADPGFDRVYQAQEGHWNRVSVTACSRSTVNQVNQHRKFVANDLRDRGVLISAGDARWNQ
jgi:hypothetical protein